MHAGAVPAISAVVPPAADPVSLQTATAFSAHGSQHATAAEQGAAALGRSGVGVADSAASYVAGDAAAASSYLVVPR